MVFSFLSPATRIRAVRDFPSFVRRAELRRAAARAAVRKQHRCARWEQRSVAGHRAGTGRAGATRSPQYRNSQYHRLSPPAQNTGPGRRLQDDTGEQVHCQVITHATSSGACPFGLYSPLLIPSHSQYSPSSGFTKFPTWPLVIFVGYSRCHDLQCIFSMIHFLALVGSKIL